MEKNMTAQLPQQLKNNNKQINQKLINQSISVVITAIFVTLLIIFLLKRQPELSVKEIAEKLEKNEKRKKQFLK